MMTVKEIERAIVQLPKADFAELAVWFEEFESRLDESSGDDSDKLMTELRDWEAASDEDLLKFEKDLAEIG